MVADGTEDQAPADPKKALRPDITRAKTGDAARSAASKAGGAMTNALRSKAGIPGTSKPSAGAGPAAGSGPDGEQTAGDIAKDAAKNLAKDALKGAATGGWVGAAKGAAFSLAKNKAIQKRVIIPLIVVAIAVPSGLAIAVPSVLSAMLGGATASSQQSSSDAAQKGGLKPEDISAARLAAAGTGIPWEIFAAYKKSTDKTLEGTRFSDALRTIDPSFRGRNMGAGASTQAGAVRVILDEKEGNKAGKAEADNVQKTYVTALAGIDELGDAKAAQIYKKALGWYLGQVSQCNTDTDSGAVVDGAELNPDQTAIAKTIIGVTKSATTNVSAQFRQRAAEIAIATGLVETHLTNITEKVDHTSLGVFQQQDWWGTPEQRNDPAWAAAKFLSVMFKKVPDWTQGDAGAVAQTVQVSAFPDRYSEVMPKAKSIVSGLWSTSPALPLPADLDFSGSVKEGGDEPSTCVAPSGDFVFPFDPKVGGAKISDWYSPDSSRPGYRRHDGIDISAAEGSPIFAAAAGTVTETGYSAGGLGNYVIIDHGAGASARYLHMVEAPMVKEGDIVTAGQQIGKVGTTGDSTGNHLHFDLSMDGKRIDPVPYLLAHGLDFRVIPLLPPTLPYYG